MPTVKLPYKMIGGVVPCPGGWLIVPARLAGVTINGLAIINEHPVSWTYAHVQPPGGLANYYRENVTGGPGSFVLEIHEFRAFGESMIRKLVSEIAGIAPGGAVATAAR